MKKAIYRLKHILIPGVLILVMLVVLVPSLTENTDFSMYDNAMVLAHVEYLAGPELKGRLTGSPGNEKAMDYIREAFAAYGLKPINANGNYDQPFSATVPDYSAGGILKVRFEDGTEKQYQMYRDYRMYAYGIAGSADYEGDFAFVDSYLTKVAVDKIKGKVVILKHYEVDEERQQYLIDNGAAGILIHMVKRDATFEPNPETMKGLGSGEKIGQTIPMGAISESVYDELKVQAKYREFEISGTKNPGSVAGTIPGCTWKQQVVFNTVNTANIIGVIEGKTDEVVVIAAHLDHVGEGVNGEYFPGALDNASGTAMLLELARVCSLQPSKPEKTLVFAAFNAEEVGLVGASYYVKHPLYPIEKTQIFNIDMIGGYAAPAIQISGISEADRILSSRYAQFAVALDQEVHLIQTGVTDAMPFSEANAPGVWFSQGGEGFYHKMSDVPAQVSPEVMAQNAALFTSIIKRDFYRSWSLDFLTVQERLIIAIYLFGLLCVFVVEALRKTAGLKPALAHGVEVVVYSPLYIIFKRCYGFLTSVVILLILLGVMTQLPTDFNSLQLEGQRVDNFSPYFTMQKTALYYRQLFTEGFGKTFRGNDAVKVIGGSFVKSGKLLLFSLFIAVPLGILKGYVDSFGGKLTREASVFSSLFLLSIPDMLWVLLAFFLTVQIGKQGLGAEWLSGENLRGWVMPLLTLTILPTLYISRIALVAAEEELSKPYILALRAKGFSKGRIFLRHLTKPLLIKVFDSLAGLTTIMISNLILIEYLFDYKGIVNNILVYAFNEDKNTFIGLVLGLGFMFVICLITFRGVSYLLYPRKQEVRS